ncbi:hypothetical protein CPC08DRAFT_104736 [Agrocybe pediades]|nr:hypothetical protein CPC08DRAFT_104736 [Agrocybe pediades]
MQPDIPVIRMCLYGALTLFSFILFCLTAARINYTNHIPKGDPLNRGRNFTDPVAGEILFTTLITMPWSIFMILCIHKRLEKPYFTFLYEIIGLAILWLFWIGGAAGATTPWGSLGWCQQFEACRILSALVAFAWLGWIVLTALLALTLLFTLANKSMHEQLHGRWNPRESTYGPDMSSRA